MNLATLSRNNVLPIIHISSRKTRRVYEKAKSKENKVGE